MRRPLVGTVLALLGAVLYAQSDRPRGIALANLTWIEAERALDASTVVVIPLGAAAKEHGPHLKLNNDERLAKYLTARIEAAARVVIAPALTYHYFPSFVEYPGSTTLTLATARDMTTQVVRSLARYGPRRFYVLNTGISTLRALEPAARLLADEGILMQYTDLDAKTAPTVRTVQQQPGGSHADEIETSMMLYVDPASVDMSKAVRDYYPGGAARLTRTRGGPGTYSQSGVYGDPTLATPDKGRIIVEALVQGVLDDIEKVRSAPLPASSAAPARDVSPPPASGTRNVVPGSPACSGGDDRAIRNLGTLFGVAWSQMDADRIARLFADLGDMRHPDGKIERGRDVIRVNRQQLFSRREYRGSVHTVTLNDVRCLSPDLAVADGKWELRGVTDTEGNARSPYAGLCTLVARRGTDTWMIEAWRYTVDPPPNSTAPTILKRPGWPGGQ